MVVGNPLFYAYRTTRCISISPTSLHTPIRMNRRFQCSSQPIMGIHAVSYTHLSEPGDMPYLERLILLLTFCLPLSSCLFKGREGKEKKLNYFIEWDTTSLLRVVEEGVYPRSCRLKDGSLLLVYENGRGDVFVTRSEDEGVSWSDPVVAYAKFEYCLLYTSRCV